MSGNLAYKKKKNIEIRDACEEDLLFLLDIYNEVIAHTTAVYSTELVTLENRAAWFAQRKTAGFPVLVAQEVGEGGCVVVGYASLGEWRGAWSGYRYTVEHSVHVRADRRGEGIGQSLLAALMIKGRALGMHVLLGAIDAANEGSLRFHARLGFVEVARFPQVGRKFERWLDLVFMQAYLDAPGASRNDEQEIP